MTTELRRDLCNMNLLHNSRKNPTLLTYMNLDVLACFEQQPLSSPSRQDSTRGSRQ
uniref:Uncharacterized protein n=1 Tax=Manihot esculenta TaxID=3983 RepID=A0A2C9W966_MANES